MFVVNVPFLYLLKTSENVSTKWSNTLNSSVVAEELFVCLTILCRRFLKFPWSIEMEHWPEMGQN